MPEPVAPTPTVATPPPAEAKKPDDFLKPKFDELERNRKILQGERAKFDQERADAAKADAKAKADAEALRLDRLRNPAKYLEQEYGPEWRKTLTEVAEKGTPPAALVASEVGDVEKRLTAKLEEVAKSLEDKFSAQQKAETERALRAADESAVAHVKANTEAFPLINAWDALASVPASIRQHFDETCEWDGETLTKPGEVWTPQQAAEDLEKKFNALVDKAVAIRAVAKPKGAAPTLPPAVTAPKTTEPPKPGEWRPVRDDREAADRAWQAALKARTPTNTSPTAH